MLRANAVILLVVLTTAAVAACVPDGPGPTTTVDDATCQMERQTIEAALDAHRDETGNYPAVLDELMDRGYFEFLTLPWSYASDGFTYTLDSAACAPGGGSTTTTVDDADCDIERRTIETALAAYDAELRRFPVALQDLVDEGYLERYSFDWAYSSDTTTYSLTGPC